MKRSIISLVLSALLLSLLCGCASEESDNGPASTTSPSGGISSESPTPTEQTLSPDAQPSDPPKTDGTQPKEPLLWPQELMGDLPDPGCEVIAITNEGTRVQVVLEGISAEAVKEYIQSMWELGYTAQTEGEGDNGEIMCGARKDDESVVLMYEPDGGDPPGSGLLQISLETK